MHLVPLACVGWAFGPDLRPSKALLKLQRLFDRHAFWARGRSFGQLRQLLAGSDAVVSLWRGKRLVASEGQPPMVSAEPHCGTLPGYDLQGHGLGRRVIEELLHTRPVGRGKGLSNDDQECRVLQATGL